MAAGPGFTRPTVVYARQRDDANPDHQVVFRAVCAACRPMTVLGSTVERFLPFETTSSTDRGSQVGDRDRLARPAFTRG